MSEGIPSRLRRKPSLSFSLSIPSFPFVVSARRKNAADAEGGRGRGGLMVILVPSSWVKEGTRILRAPRRGDPPGARHWSPWR